MKKSIEDLAIVERPRADVEAGSVSQGENTSARKLDSLKKKERKKDN